MPEAHVDAKVALCRPAVSLPSLDQVAQEVLGLWVAVGLDASDRALPGQQRESTSVGSYQPGRKPAPTKRCGASNTR